MQCRICGAEAMRVSSGYDGLELKCSGGCGHFKIDGSTLAAHKDRSYNVQRTRSELDAARHNRPGDVPEINGYMTTILD